MVSRKPVIAGSFYPGEPQVLAGDIQRYLDGAVTATDAASARARTVIAPHAGYVYSGATAARAYHAISGALTHARTIAVLGPSHRVALSSIALPSADAFETPLGAMRIDRLLADTLVTQGLAVVNDPAHAWEHSIEVHLPFLQTIAPSAELLPIVVGDVAPGAVSAAIEYILDDPDVALIVSSDLSHFHPYHEAQRIDAATALAIESLRTDVSPEQACGCRVINGMNMYLADSGGSVTTLEVVNSGDTAGDRARVVGYGAFQIDRS